MRVDKQAGKLVSWLFMKTTIDLPEKLVHHLKMRAALEKRRLKDLAAEYLQAGLSRGNNEELPRPVIVTDEVTGLPVIHSPGPAPHAAEMTPDRIKDILLEQEVEWAREAAGH